VAGRHHRLLGGELVGHAVIGGLQPGHDDAGPVEQIPLHARRIEVLAGLLDGEGARRCTMIGNAGQLVAGKLWSVKRRA